MAFVVTKTFLALEAFDREVDNEEGPEREVREDDKGGPIDKEEEEEEAAKEVTRGTLIGLGT